MKGNIFSGFIEAFPINIKHIRLGNSKGIASG